MPRNTKLRRPQPALFQGGDLSRRTVARNYYLLLRIIESIEGMKELLLRAFFARQKLDVVHKQHVDVAVLVPELDRLVVSDSVDQFIHKTLGRQVG